jgi:hypothetical protein
MDFRWVALLGFLALAGASLVTRHAELGLVMLVLAGVASPVPFYKMPGRTYEVIHDSRADLEWDVYGAAVKLQHVVSHYSPSTGAVGFWYTNRTGSLLRSVQSVYLWGYSRLELADKPGDGMPTLTPAVIARIRLFRYLVLLSETAGEVERAKAALSSAGVNVRFLAATSFDGSRLHVKYLVLERLDEPPVQPASPRTSVDPVCSYGSVSRYARERRATVSFWRSDRVTSGQSLPAMPLVAGGSAC